MGIVEALKILREHIEETAKDKPEVKEAFECIRGYFTRILGAMMRSN